MGSGSGGTSGEADSVTTGSSNPATADAGDVFFNTCLVAVTGTDIGNETMMSEFKGLISFPGAQVKW